MREPLVEHRLELAGFEMRALELEGPPLVLLHGFADSADSADSADAWRLVLDRMVTHLVEALGQRDDFAYELYEGGGHCTQVEMPGTVS